jgi:hypothetical protein
MDRRGSPLPRLTALCRLGQKPGQMGTMDIDHRGHSCDHSYRGKRDYLVLPQTLPALRTPRALRLTLKREI